MGFFLDLTRVSYHYSYKVSVLSYIPSHNALWYQHSVHIHQCYPCDRYSIPQCLLISAQFCRTSLLSMWSLFYPTMPSDFSTVSSYINANCAIVWEDVLVQWYSGIPEKKKTLINKILTILLGMGAMATAFLAQNIGGTFIQVKSDCFIIGKGKLEKYLKEEC